jgi:hypothetical protein
MSGNGGTGLMAEITPMEELYIQVMAPITTAQVKAGTTYKNLRAGFAYTVPGTVKIKGQYIGKGAASEDGKDATTKTVKGYAPGDIEYIEADGTVHFSDTATPTDQTITVPATPKKDGNSNCTLEAEVDVLAVEGLTAGVGFQYNVIKDGKDNSPDSVKTKIALGASYQVMPELKVTTSGAFFMYYGDKVDPRWQAGLGVDYDLGDGLALNADARYLAKSGYDGEKADNTDHIAFSVGVTKSVSSNGYIGVAFQGQTNSGNFANTVITGKPNDDGEMKNFTWAIPVALSVWF